MSKLIRLGIEDIARIMQVERTAFIPSIQTDEKNILKRLSKNHTYLGVEVGDELIGTLALRFAYFIPYLGDFIRRNPNFDYYAEHNNDENANSVFVYSIGVVPKHRNSTHARRLLEGALDLGLKKDLDFLVGDSRIPSYNGSNDHPEFEQFDKNEELHQAVDDYFKTGILPEDLIREDPVSGFYLRVLPGLRNLGITSKYFWGGDDPCGGHMVIQYLDLKIK